MEVVHYLGGPCSPEEISTCVVTGGHGCGWTVVTELSDAIELAHMRAFPRTEAQGAIRGGQIVELTGLTSRPELNGERGVALQFVEATGRWLVRLKDGGGKSLKPENPLPKSHAEGVVHCVWGTRNGLGPSSSARSREATGALQGERRRARGGAAAAVGGLGGPTRSPLIRR